jgi:cytochrome c
MDQINAAIYSPAGQRLFTADENGAVKVWELATGQETFAIPGEGDGITSLAISGHRLATAYEDGTIRILDGTPLKDD